LEKRKPKLRPVKNQTRDAWGAKEKKHTKQKAQEGTENLQALKKKKKKSRPCHRGIAPSSQIRIVKQVQKQPQNNHQSRDMKKGTFQTRWTKTRRGDIRQIRLPEKPMKEQKEKRDVGQKMKTSINSIWKNGRRLPPRRLKKTIFQRRGQGQRWGTGRGKKRRGKPCLAVHW